MNKPQKTDFATGTMRDPTMAPAHVAAIPPGAGICLFIEKGSRGSGGLFTLSAHRSYIVGRGDADILIDDERVSRKHAEIRLKGSRQDYCLRDLASSNGTFLNGQRVVGTRTLQHYDVIRIGETSLRFIDDPAGSGV